MRFVAKVLGSIVIVFATLLAIVAALLHTSYALPVLKQSVAFFTPVRFDANALDYHLTEPLTVSLIAPVLDDGTGQVYRASHLSLTVDPSSLWRWQPRLAALMINKTTLSPDHSSWLPDSLFIRQLAIEGLTLDTGDLVLSGADVQLTDWHNSPEPFGRTGGKFQLAAPSLQWQQYALDDILVDSEKQGGKWEVWGFSFNWSGASVTGSATLEPGKRLTFQQLTVSDVKWQDPDVITGLEQGWEQVVDNYAIDIQRFDLLDFNAEMQGFAANHLNLSIQSLSVAKGYPVPALAQEPVLLSFNVGLLKLGQTTILDPIADVELGAGKIEINGVSAKVYDGYISFDGNYRQGELALNKLVLNGMDIEVTPVLAALAARYSQTIDALAVNQLSTSHLKISGFESPVPYQLVSLNIKGSNLELVRNGVWRMWHGEMSASAAGANVNRIQVLEPYLEMKHDSGIWQVARLSMSFKEGQLLAEGSWQLEHESRPWHLAFTGLGVPLDIYDRWFGVTAPLGGRHDIEGEFRGLGANQDSLAYSFSGAATAQPHDWSVTAAAGSTVGDALAGLLTPPAQAASSGGSVTLPLTAPQVAIKADRGRIRLAPVKIQSGNKQFQLDGQWDLATGTGALSVDGEK